MVQIDPRWLEPVSNMLEIERYQEALAVIPPPGRGCHPALLSVANRGIAAGIDAERLAADLRAAIPAGKRRVPDREIQAAVDKAVEDAESGICVRGRLTKPAPPKPRIDGERMRNKIMAEGSEDEADLWAASPIRLDGAAKQDAALLLDTLYDADEFLFIGDLFDRAVHRVADWRRELEKRGPVWPHIIPNPVDGQPHDISTGGQSYRCDAAVCGFRFAVAEFDGLPRTDQLAFWSGVVFLGLVDVAAVIDSGGKSLHAWLRVDCRDRGSWERDIEQDLFARWLAPMGIDPACRNESRLSRLPGHLRTDSGRRQRLLYLANR